MQVLSQIIERLLVDIILMLRPNEKLVSLYTTSIIENNFSNSMKAIFLLCIILFAIIAYHIRNNIIEDFPQPIDVYQTFPPNHSDWTVKYGKNTWATRQILTENWGNFLTTISQNVATLGDTSSSTVLYICDPLDRQNFFKNFTEVGKSPIGYFIGISSIKEGYTISCPFDFAGKYLGYFDRSDLYFIKALMSAYRIDTSLVNLIKLEVTDLPNLENILNEKGINIIISFIIPNNNLFKQIREQNVSLIGFKNLDWNRLNLFYPFTIQTSTKISTIFMAGEGVNALVKAAEDDTILPTMRLSILNLTGSPPQITEKFITQLDISKDALDPTFQCYGDRNISSKYLCESPYDVIGLPKLYPTTWDQPCVVDSDCPYHKANNKYDNNRGGCLSNGICEFPIGVKRIAYRKNNHDGIYAPFSYDCDPYDTNCSNRPGADIAFDNDTASRQAAGLPTTLPIK
jgi:hypothetical protein